MATSNTKIIATYVLSVSQFCVAIALVYFSIKISEVTQSIPDLLTGMETTAAKIEPMVNEINGVRELVPPILEEIKQTRLMIPPILKETARIRAVIPDITKSLNSTSDAIVMASTEVTVTRKYLPELLRQVDKTRDAIPPILVDAERIVDKAQQTGKKATEGAVTGLLTGIVTVPYDLIGTGAYTLLNLNTEELSDKDRDMILKMSLELLNSGIEVEMKAWTNPENGNKSVISYVKSYSENDRDCKILKLEVDKSNENIVSKNITACLDENSEWKIQD